MSQLLEKIKKDQLEARKEKNKERAKVLTTLLGSAAPSGNQTVTDEQVIAVVKKFVKSANETKEDRSKFGYDTSDTDFEIGVLYEYLPKQLNTEEMEDIAQQVIDDRGLESVKQMGQVMAYFDQNHKGEYDAKELSGIVRGLLN